MDEKLNEIKTESVPVIDDSQIIYYNPQDPAYLSTSPTYIGPKMK